MSCRVLQALALVSSVLALSSTSPLDLFSHPRYQIVLTHHGISNETATWLLAHSPGEGEPAYHLMRTKGGQGFLCSVPPASSVQLHPSASAIAEQGKAKAREDKKAGLDRGLALLEPLKGSCLYLRQGWFTYAFCHGSEIRQFHEIRQPGSHLPTEDPNFEAYTLGQYEQPSAEVAAGSSTGALQDILSGTGGLDLDDAEKRYLVQNWRGGTLCDKTGLERSVEVQFHCNTQSTDRIALIREVSICEYVMVVHTPRLCGEPTFLGSENDPLKSVTLETRCQPILTQAMAGAIEAPGEEPSPSMESVTAEASVAEQSTESAAAEVEGANQDEHTVEAIADAIQSVLDSSDLAADLIVTLDTTTGEFQVEKSQEMEPLDSQDRPAEENLQRINKFEDMLKEAIEQTVKVLEQLQGPGNARALIQNHKLRQLAEPAPAPPEAAKQVPERPMPGSSRHHRLARMYAGKFDAAQKDAEGTKERREHVTKPKDEL